MKSFSSCSKFRKRILNILIIYSVRWLRFSTKKSNWRRAVRQPASARTGASDVCSGKRYRNDTEAILKRYWSNTETKWSYRLFVQDPDRELAHGSLCKLVCGAIDANWWCKETCRRGTKRLHHVCASFLPFAQPMKRGKTMILKRSATRGPSPKVAADRDYSLHLMSNSHSSIVIRVHPPRNPLRERSYLELLRGVASQTCSLWNYHYS